MNELQKLMNQITDLGNQIRIATAAFAAHATDTSVSIADLEKEQAGLNEMNKRLATMQAAYAAMTQAAAATVQPTGGANPTGSEGQSRTLKDMLKSNEYARAFAYQHPTIEATFIRRECDDALAAIAATADANVLETVKNNWFTRVYEAKTT